ncbi:KGK domain-containing protein [Microcoleus sp. bin38.metabat.b11b12b14.051]|uniref:KGK domain-containing protein n=1 Tax=Microcoleus sp. bin38.metabat.b11b12b14.051 TaxID=2742709 RepID=UPI0025EAD8A8|nr:KGK domain-containing protein [Microcoleus sp. bin38.metabat.b11b12b14.051]
MNDKFQPLDRDDDVLLFDDNTFTVGKIKDLISKQFQEKFLSSYQKQPSYRGDLYEDRTDIKSDLSTVSFDSGSFLCSEIQWKSIKAVNCKLLKVGSGGWQEGKLRMQAKVVNSYYENDDYKNYNKAVLDICIEFSPNLPNEPISPLDDIRQSEEYKKLSNNN